MSSEFERNRGQIYLDMEELLSMSDFKTKSSVSLIRTLLNDPLLPEKIRQASASELVQWINKIGLEDAAEIVAFASTKQIEEIFDVDLWKLIRSGGDEIFDADRFGTWLEILSEIGTDKAVEKLVEMEEDFLVMAFSSLVWVAETDWLEANCEANPQIEKTIESKLIFEIDSYTLFGKTEQSWDAFISLITAMDVRHHSFLYGILDRCFNFLTQEVMTEDDLYELLSDEEQIVEDVAYEREKRRESQGFIAPAVARSFLKLCEMELEVEDLVTPKYLLAKKESFGDERISGHSKDIVSSSQTRFKNIQVIFEKHPNQIHLLTEQINYLANILMSGWDWKNEERRPGRALEIVLELCEDGLQDSSEKFSSFPRSFRLGWRKNKRNQKP